MTSPWKKLGQNSDVVLSFNGQCFVIRNTFELDGAMQYDTVELTIDEAEELHNYMSAFFPRVRNGELPLPEIEIENEQ